MKLAVSSKLLPVVSDKNLPGSLHRLQRSGIGAQSHYGPTCLFTRFGSRSPIRRFHGCRESLQIQVGAVGRRSGLLPPRLGQGPDVERIKSEVIDELCNLLLVLDPVSGKRKRDAVA